MEVPDHRDSEDREKPLSRASQKFHPHGESSRPRGQRKEALFSRA